MRGQLTASLCVCVPLLVLTASCTSPAPQSTPPGPRASQMAPVPQSAENPSTPDKVALGKQLFFDTRLSRDGSASCESCHFRNLGWTDAKKFSTRVGGTVNPRHTPTLYNVAYSTAWYWDGRLAPLERQIAAAWAGQMGADPKVIAANLAAVPGYASQFQKVFGAPPTADNIPMALAAYIRTLSSGTSPWDRYEMGDKRAVSQDAIDGNQLFNVKGGCIKCHHPGAYSDFQFHNIGLEAGKEKPDLGRNAVTKAVADTSSFKTPTLRSVGISGPYFHDGSAATLEDAVRYMASGGKADPNKSPLLTNSNFSEAEVAKVAAFLRSLTSDEPLVKPTLP